MESLLIPFLPFLDYFKKIPRMTVWYTSLPIYNYYGIKLSMFSLPRYFIYPSPSDVFREQKFFTRCP